MSSNLASSAVRDLRAMFENNDSASPEPRGRSPAGSVTSNGDGHTLNKVHTSFVPVEPINPNMTQTPSKEGNGDAAPAEDQDRKGSFSSSVEQELASIVGDSTDSSLDDARQKQLTPAKVAAVSTATEGTPESAIIPKKEGDDMDKQVNDLADGLRKMSLPSEVPSGHPDKVTSAIEEEDVAMKPSDPKDKEAVSGGAALPPPQEPLPNLSTHSQQEISSLAVPNAAESNSGGKGLEATPSTAMQNGHSTNRVSKTSTSPTKSSSKKSKPTPVRAQPVSARRTSPKKDVPASLAAAALKSPATPMKHSTNRKQATPTSTNTAATMNGTPASSNDATAVNGYTSPTSSRAATKPSNSKAPRTSLTAPTAASLSKVAKPRLSSASAASATSTASKKPTRSPPSSNPGQVRVPSHLTATASSAAKHGAASAGAATSSASSNIARKPFTLKRDPAAASRLTKPTASNAAKTVRRPSLPKQNGIKRPESRSSRADTAPAPTRKEVTKSAAPGFLERMTRPTASSSSKTHEKIETGKA